jgi:hypothetical protein
VPARKLREIRSASEHPGDALVEAAAGIFRTRAPSSPRTAIDRALGDDHDEHTTPGEVMSTMQGRATLRVTVAVVFAILVVAAVGSAGHRRPLDAGASSCAASGPPSGRFQPIRFEGTDFVRAALDRLSEHELKAFYAGCSHQSIERRLDGAEAMACSIAYDVLLKKYFGGDFSILLIWSRAQEPRHPTEPSGR